MLVAENEASGNPSIASNEVRPGKCDDCKDKANCDQINRLSQETESERLRLSQTSSIRNLRSRGNIEEVKKEEDVLIGSDPRKRQKLVDGAYRIVFNRDNQATFHTRTNVRDRSIDNFHGDAAFGVGTGTETHYRTPNPQTTKFGQDPRSNGSNLAGASMRPPSGGTNRAGPSMMT